MCRGHESREALAAIGAGVLVLFVFASRFCHTIRGSIQHWLGSSLPQRHF